MQALEYIPRHLRPMVIEVKDLKVLRKLVDQLPEGTVYSIGFEEVVADGQETK